MPKPLFIARALRCAAIARASMTGLVADLQTLEAVQEEETLEVWALVEDA